MANFPANYSQARQEFVSAAGQLGASLQRLTLECDADLSIDVAILRPAAPKRIVVSSGVHGVEGPFGSAVQTSWLADVADSQIPDDIGVLMIHAVNPFGFAHDRRFNEDNVDLNRNFMDQDDQYHGAPEGYHRLNGLLNPASLPSRWEPFRLKAALQIARHGLPALKGAIATGQYEYPRGIFFGGSGPSNSVRLLREHFPTWVQSAQEITHVDFHTGLGSYGEHAFLLDQNVSDDVCDWFRKLFGDAVIDGRDKSRNHYPVRGSFIGWTARQVGNRPVRSVVAEFGTYSGARVLAALRAENRVFHYASDRDAWDWVLREIRESFCPVDPRWRSKVVTAGKQIIDRCIAAMSL